MLGVGKEYTSFFEWVEKEKKFVLELEECMRETTLKIWILYIAILY